jgi:hypothetical protein
MLPNSRSVAIFISIFTVSLALSASATAQENRQRRSVATEATTSPKLEPKLENTNTAAPTKLVSPPGADFLSGEANVGVSGNQNPVIRLGLSPYGATIIEFPAADRLFNIIPGNSNLVTVEESPTKETDHFLIVRPGDGFASPATMVNTRRAPATSVIVQMQSGLVLTFLFYPVQQLAEQAHRVVVTYDRNEVLASRRAAGLAVDLDRAIDANRPRTTSLRITRQPDLTQPDEATPPGTKSNQSSQSNQAPIAVGDLTEVDTSEPPLKRAAKSSDPARNASLALTDATKSPKSFKKWSDSIHGLSLSVSPIREVDKHSQMVVIAVRNTKSKDARIIPGQPEIHLETLDGKKRPIHIETVRKLAIDTTAVDDVIPGGEIRYYAVVYETPIMGARQRLRVAIGQTTAADEPATVNLTSSNR